MYYIYAYENKINGKIYIGQTNNPEKRFRDHKTNGINSSTIVDRAIAKYGIDKFEWWIFNIVDNIDIANCEEMYWIFEMREKLGKDNVYNIRDGGNNSPKSEEWKQKMSEIHSRNIKNRNGAGYRRGKSKLTIEQKQAIIKDPRPSRQIAKDYGMEKTQILRIKNGVQ